LPHTEVHSPASPAIQLIVSGAPASGKGTQCERIVAEFGVVHLSTGDMLRDAVAAGSGLGKAAKGAMEGGKLVTDALVIGIVLERLARPDCKARGWLLDGFPRSRVQADALKKAGVSPDAFVLLHVPPEDLVARVVGRRLDPETGKIYHIESNPPPAEVKHRVIQRSDDAPETVKQRLAIYESNLTSVLSAFDDKEESAGTNAIPVVATIDGSRKPDLVYVDVRAAIAERSYAKWAGRMAEDGITNFRDHPPAKAQKGTQPVVVLVHGIGAFSFIWDELAAKLTAEGVRVISYDLLGRGHSLLPPNKRDGGSNNKLIKLGATAHVAQLRSLLVGLGLGEAPIVLIGHSMGGALAALYTQEYGGSSGQAVGGGGAVGQAPGSGAHVVGLALLAPAGLMDSGLLRAARGLAAIAPSLMSSFLKRGQDDAQTKDFTDVNSDGAKATRRTMRLQAELHPQTTVRTTHSDYEHQYSML